MIKATLLSTLEHPEHVKPFPIIIILKGYKHFVTVQDYIHFITHLSVQGCILYGSFTS